MISDFLSTIKRSWQSHFATNIATTTVLTLCFCLVAGLILINMNLSRLLAVWGKDVQVSIYLKDGITPSEKLALETALKADGKIETLVFVSKDQAAKDFNLSLKSFGSDFLESVLQDGNPFPASYQVRLAQDARTPEVIEEVAANYKTFSGLDEVSFGKEWVKNYSTIVRIFRGAAFYLTFAVFLACILTVSNSIRASLGARRSEIEILELVGATANMVRKPFVFEGAFQGFVSMFVAQVLLYVFYQFSYESLGNFTGTASIVTSLSFFSLPMIIFLIFLGTSLGAIGSLVCVARLNTGWAAAKGSS